jgi:hypothetical protein
MFSTISVMEKACRATSPRTRATMGKPMNPLFEDEEPRPDRTEACQGRPRARRARAVPAAKTARDPRA